MVKNILLISYFLLNYYFSFSQNNSLDDIQSLNNIYQQIKDSDSFPRFSFFYKKSSILNTIENNKNKYLIITYQLQRILVQYFQREEIRLDFQ